MLRSMLPPAGAGSTLEHPAGCKPAAFDVCCSASKQRVQMQISPDHALKDIHGTVNGQRALQMMSTALVAPAADQAYQVA
jgi:hypothetical protein